MIKLKEKESSGMLTEISLKETGSKAKLTATESTNPQPAALILAIGKMIYSMGVGRKRGRMEARTLATTQTARKTEKAYINTQMAEPILAIGLKMK